MAERRRTATNLGAIMQLALSVSLRQRSLWVWALISALPSTALQYAMSEVTRGPDRFRAVLGLVADLEPSWLAVGVLGAFALLLLAVLAEGALIAGASVAIAGQGGGLVGAWRASISRFRALVALHAILFMGIVAYLSPLLLLLFSVGAHTTGNDAVRAPHLLVGAGLLWLFGLIPALLWWYGVGNYAIRGCILRGEGSIRAISRGHQVLKRHLRTSLLATVVAAIGQMLFGLVFTGGLLAFVRPFAVLARGLDNAMGRFLTVGVPAFFVLQALIIGLAQVTFVQVFWTAVYQELAPAVLDDMPVIEGR